MDEIPQIKPKSILDPVKNGGVDELPQIKLDTEVAADGAGKTASGPVKSGMMGRKGGKFLRRGLSFRPSFGGKAKAVLGGVAVVLVVGLVAVGLPALAAYRRGMSVMKQAQAVKASVDAQDINLIKQEIGKLDEELGKFETAYGRLGWMRAVPWVGGYWKDGKAGISAGKHGIETALVVIDTVSPYADIIGFAGGEGAQSGEETANDRIEFLVQTIDEVLPRMDEIVAKAELARAEALKINTSHYPEKFRGKEVRSKLEKLVRLADEGVTMLAESKPLMEAAPYLLGMDEERTYLVLFQNDKELRPTGGFITAYSIMKVRNGKLSPVSSSDIYDLDNKYRPSIEAPEQFADYIKGIYVASNMLRLRDMNWSPDFAESMRLFTKEVEGAGISDVDGVIAVDTHVVVNILEVLGQIGVPGFGNFSTEIAPECDCPQVVYELESFADVEGPVVWSENEPGKIVFAPPNYDNRKKIVGPLMNSVIANALGQEKAKLPDLFMAAWKSVTEKHALVYLFDEEAQAGAEGFGIAGKIEGYEGDYLHVSDANLGGRKSNLYVTQEVAQEIEVARDGTVTKTLTLTYNNPKEQDGWLNSVLPNWTRVYVPLGSELVSMEGFDDKGEVYEELGKTVFSGGFELRPLGVKKITITYKLPRKMEGDYNLLVQKQPGKDAPLYTIKLGRQTEELFLNTDREFRFRI